jgi:hypothetical protein
MAIDELLGTCKTGDLIYFQSVGTVMGLCISVFSDIWPSHVAMVVRVRLADARECGGARGELARRIMRTLGAIDGGLEWYTGGEESSVPLLWETVRHNEGLVDLLTGQESKNGPQLVDLRARMDLHAVEDGGRVATRRVVVPLAARAPNGSGGVSAEAYEKMCRYMLEVSGFGYESNPFALSDSLLKWFCCMPLARRAGVGDPFVSRRYFCSQLQADTYSIMGILAADRESRHYTLKDWTRLGEYLTFHKGGALGGEMCVALATAEAGEEESGGSGDEQ